MFGKKRIDTSLSLGEKVAGDKEQTRIHTIPDVFYGGADPELYHAQSQERADNSAVAKTQTPASQRSGANAPSHHRMRFIIAAGVVFLALSLGGISWYYISRARTASVSPPVAAESEPIIPAAAVVAPILPPVAPPAVETEATSTQQRDPFAFVFPSLTLVDTADLDADALTDVEEEVFHTDSGVEDTDADGYYDGQEVEFLYNPSGEAPTTLQGSDLVQEYVNPTWQYRLFMPAQWQAAAVDAQANEVLLSALSGDFIQIIAVPKEAGESFVDWFGRVATGERFTDLKQITNRLGASIWRRGDWLVGYSEGADAVFVILYHPAEVAGTVSYRHVMTMAIQSFRPSRTTVEVPQQEIVPSEIIPAPVATSTVSP